MRGGLFNKLWAIVVGAFVSLQLQAQPQQQPPQQVPFPKVEQQELFLQAIEALDAGKTNSMVKLLDRAVQLDTANQFAYVKRAQLFDLVGNNVRAIKDYSAALGLNSTVADIYQLRGCSHFKMGNVLAAVQDWQIFIQLKPKKETEHWQICVGHALLGNYEEARKRFEWHWTVNTEDMEVAFWHFLCVARTEGLAKARENLMTVSGEKRVPMAQIYELYKGEGDESSVWLAAANGTPNPVERAQREFFAHYYLGLLRQAEGHLEDAKTSVTKALEIARSHDGFIGDSPGGQLRGGDIANVHFKQINQKLAEQLAYTKEDGEDSSMTLLVYLGAGVGLVLLVGYSWRRRQIDLPLAQKSST